MRSNMQSNGEGRKEEEWKKHSKTPSTPSMPIPFTKP